MSQTKAELVNGLSVNAALADAITVDSSGNVGIGITPDSHGGTVKSLQIGTATNLYNETSDDYTILGNNVYFDGSNNKYIKTQESSRLLQNAGEFTFQQAVSGSADANISYTTPLKINSSGNVGIGKTPSDRLDVQTTHSSGGRIATFYNSDSGNNGGLIIQGGGSDGEARLQSAGGSSFLTFYTEGSGSLAERLRIDSSGGVRFGATAAIQSEKYTFFRQESDQNTLAYFHQGASADVTGIIMRHGRGLSGFAGKMIGFLRNDGTEVGSILIGNSSVAYNTSSDYRLKENVVGISDGISRLKTLKPSKFNFIGDSKIVDGFLAHEVTAVPEAISGIKDEVATEDNEKTGVKKGDPIYQGIDQSKLVPLLTAALQEEIGKREALEARVATLEAA